MERAREAAPCGIAKVLAAAEFAAFKHREQRRKGASGSPYINHPLAVASTLATEAGVEDADVLAAAINPLLGTADDQHLDFNRGRYQTFKYRIYQDHLRHNLGSGPGALSPFSGIGGGTSPPDVASKYQA